MRARAASIECIYNQKTVPESIEEVVEQFSYSDPATGEGDSVSFTINARNDQWLGSMLPTKGSSLQCAVAVQDWGRPSDDQKLQCGKFLVDEVSLSGQPTVLNFKGISSPVNQAFSATERTQNWENVTIHKIAQEIAQRSGVGLIYDAAEVQIVCLEQNKQTDSAFLSDLTQKYGLSMKVYMDKIVLFDRETYKQKPAVTSIDVRNSAKSWSVTTDITGSYTGGTFRYTDSDKGIDIGCTLGSGGRMLTMNDKADSFSDAAIQLAAALNAANHGKTAVQLETMGNPSLVAGQCIGITNLGNFNGKYFIDEVDHSLSKSEGYCCSYKLSLCLPPFEASEAKPLAPSAGAKFTSDTTQPVTKSVGQTYQVKITAFSNADKFACHCDNPHIATMSLTIDRIENGHRTYCYKAKGIAAGRTGVIVTVNGTPYHVYDLIIKAGNNTSAKISAGKAVSLSGCPLYASAYSSNKATTLSGTYYLYDGQNVHGKYRITNSPGRVGKTPVGSNVTGWIDAANAK